MGGRIVTTQTLYFKIASEKEDKRIEVLEEAVIATFTCLLPPPIARGQIILYERLNLQKQRTATKP